MPRKIKYVKLTGSIQPGTIEERSDIDANILVTLGVAVEVTSDDKTGEPVISAAGYKTAAITPSRAERRRLAASLKSKQPKKGRTGYNRRDMTAEERT